MPKQINEYDNMVTNHPGYYVNEKIIEMGITQYEFARRLDVSPKTISKLVNGLIPLSNEVAHKLSIVFGTSVSMWLNLQALYDEEVIQLREIKNYDHEKEYASLIDYNYFFLNGFVPEAVNNSDTIKNLCSFFRVSSLGLLSNTDIYADYRSITTKQDVKKIVNSNAWIQTAINQAWLKDVPPVRINKLKKSLNEIRSLTFEEPSTFFPKLNEIFYKCGVTFIVLPHLNNSGINGLTKWLSHKKVLVAINDKGLSTETFWFSLFHEIKHVFQQKKKITLVNTIKSLEISELNLKYKREADEFARNILIPSDVYNELIQKKFFTLDDIVNLAKKIRIHPDIVADRLQHDKQIRHDILVYLKQCYKSLLD